MHLDRFRAARFGGLRLVPLVLALAGGQVSAAVINGTAGTAGSNGAAPGAAGTAGGMAGRRSAKPAGT